MSNDPKELTEIIIKSNRKTVDRSIRTLMTELEHENTLVADTANGRVQRVLKVFRGVKPLLTVIASVPLLPTTWRAALNVLSQVLDSLAAGVSAEFKAGKDL